MFKNQKTPDVIIQEIIQDISRYLGYMGIVSMGLSGGEYALKFLPLSRAYDEHPFWLIKKIEFINSMINKAMAEVNKSKGGK